MSDQDDLPADELRETELRLRSTMDEAADGFDLDEHARVIAAEVVAARRRANPTGEDAHAKRTAERMEEERWRRRSQKRTDS